MSGTPAEQAPTLAVGALPPAATQLTGTASTAPAGGTPLNRKLALAAALLSVIAAIVQAATGSYLAAGFAAAAAALWTAVAIRPGGGSR